MYLAHSRYSINVKQYKTLLMLSAALLFGLVLPQLSALATPYFFLQLFEHAMFFQLWVPVFLQALPMKPPSSLPLSASPF